MTCIRILALGAASLLSAQASAQDSASVEVNAAVLPADAAVQMSVEQQFNLNVRSPRGSDPNVFCYYHASASGVSVRTVDANLNDVDASVGCAADDSQIALVAISCDPNIEMGLSVDIRPESLPNGPTLLRPEDHDAPLFTVVGEGNSVYGATGSEPVATVPCASYGSVDARIYATLRVPYWSEQGDFVLGTITLSAAY